MIVGLLFEDLNTANMLFILFCLFLFLFFFTLSDSLEIDLDLTFLQKGFPRLKKRSLREKKHFLFLFFVF